MNRWLSAVVDPQKQNIFKMNTVVLNQRFSWATFGDIVLTNKNHAWRSSPHSFCITVLERNSPSQLVIQNSRAWRSTCPFSLQIHQEVHHLFSWLQKNSYQQHWDQKLSGRIGCKLFFFSPKTVWCLVEKWPPPQECGNALFNMFLVISLDFISTPHESY